MQLGLSTCGTLKNVETGPASLDTFLDFTDGACEADATHVTHGAVLCDLVTQSFFFFGDHVPRKFLEDWKKGGRTKQKVFCFT